MQQPLQLEAFLGKNREKDWLELRWQEADEMNALIVGHKLSVWATNILLPSQVVVSLEQLVQARCHFLLSNNLEWPAVRTSQWFHFWVYPWECFQNKSPKFQDLLYKHSPQEIFRFATSLGIPINYKTYQRNSEEKPCIDRGNPFCPHPGFNNALKASATRYLSQGSSTRGEGFFGRWVCSFFVGVFLGSLVTNNGGVENLKSGPNKS